MGAGKIPDDPLLNYWLRMASVSFGCIGVGSAMACLRPVRYFGLVRLLGPFHLVVGTTLAISAWRIPLSPDLHPTFIPDIVFCFLTATLIQVPLVREAMANTRDKVDP